MSLIIEVRKCRKKGNCQRSQYNNIIAIKQTHGLLVLRQGLSIIFGARTFDPFHRIWNLCQMEEVNDATHKQEDLRPAGSTRVMLLLPETSPQTQQKSVLKLIKLYSLNTIRLLKPLHQTHGLLFNILFNILCIYLFGCLGSHLQMRDSPYLWWDLDVAQSLTSCGARAQLLLGCEILDSPPGIEPTSTAFQGGL